MIVTWLADVSALHEESTYQMYYEQVPDFRREKADQLKMQEDKALSIGAWTLLEWMRKEYSLHGNEIFNLSHSGTYALCTIAIGECEQVGCDIEKIGKERKGMAERYFCQDECEQIHTTEEFYRFWVLKESFQKATRMGMKLALNSFSFAFTEEGKAFLKKQPKEFEKQYYFKEYQVENLPYKIAVCSDWDAFAKEITIKRL